jgi:hypothetical protein
MDLYATWCGRALALAHARSGRSTMLSGYMGKSDIFDQALADFSVAYADQNEQEGRIQSDLKRQPTNAGVRRF